MPSPLESRAALTLITGAAVQAARRLLGSLPVEDQRDGMLDAIPALLSYFTDGSSALAADFYDDERERATAAGRFTAEPVVRDRSEKIARALLWVVDGTGEPAPRLAEVVQLEVARPYRDTITTNRQRDPQAIGWRRVTSGGCKFCQMLASRGAVYRDETARFASHGNCHCTAQPVFKGGEVGQEASALQYVASKRTRTAKQQAALRDYLNQHFPDAHG